MQSPFAAVPGSFSQEPPTTSCSCETVPSSIGSVQYKTRIRGFMRPRRYSQTCADPGVHCQNCLHGTGDGRTAEADACKYSMLACRLQKLADTQRVKAVQQTVHAAGVCPYTCPKLAWCLSDSSTYATQISCYCCARVPQQLPLPWETQNCKSNQ